MAARGCTKFEQQLAIAGKINMECEVCKTESKNWFHRIFYKNNIKFEEANNCCMCELAICLSTFFTLQVTNPAYANIIKNKAREIAKKSIEECKKKRKENA